MNDSYYPFGMEMPARTFSSPLYRYGFNGKEKDDEAKGSGEQYDYGMRIYDPRMGRFLSIDPLFRSYPMLTPYQFVSNDPIESVDADGQERVDYRLVLKKDGTTELIRTGESSKVDVQKLLGITISERPIPYHVRVEYGGHFYLFVAKGPESELAQGKILTAASDYASDGPYYYFKQLDDLRNEPNGFARTHRPVDEIDYPDRMKSEERMQLAETVVAGLASAAPAIANQVTRANSGGSTNRGVGKALENVSKRDPLKQAYEDATTGAASDVKTRKRIVPTLKYDNPNPNGKNFVKFDGFDVENNELIDRKWNVTTYDKSLNQLKRMAEALKQNPGYSGVIEVPNQKAYNNAVKALQKASVTDIKVRIAKPNQ
ncbi:MAG: RHS repeat-associated core domain-containing protein [Flavisolibacter sp.]